MPIDPGVWPVIVKIVAVTSPTVSFMPSVASMSRFIFGSGAAAGARRGGGAPRCAGCRAAAAATAAAAAPGALQIELPVVAVHDRLRAGQRWMYSPPPV